MLSVSFSNWSISRVHSIWFLFEVLFKSRITIITTPELFLIIDNSKLVSLKEFWLLTLVNQQNWPVFSVIRYLVLISIIWCSSGWMERECFARWAFVLNLSGQYPHEKGRSWSWTIWLCRVSPSLNAKLTRQALQWYGFTFWWTLRIFKKDNCMSVYLLVSRNKRCSIAILQLIIPKSGPNSW